MAAIASINYSLDIAPFTVTKASPPDHASLTETMKTWLTLTQAKIKRIVVQKFTELYPDSSLEDVNEDSYIPTLSADRSYEILKDAKSICKTLNALLASSSIVNDIYTCKDKNNTIQAIIFHDPHINKIEYLLTHPDNLTHPLLEATATPIRGAGTALILALAHQTLKISGTFRLYASSLSSSIGFYGKCGFAHPGNHICLLTQDRIIQLIEEGTPPFNRFKKID